MAHECERIFCTSVYEAMRQRVKGKVVVYIFDDIMTIRVTQFDVEFEWAINDMHTKIINGYSRENIVCEFLKAYKSYILGGYFK